MLKQRRTLAYYNRQLSKARKKKKIYDKKLEIRKIKRSMHTCTLCGVWKKPTTTKIVMAYIFINCTVVEIYSMVIMWKLQNIDALYALITAVITESISFAVYCCKSYNETKQEEIIKLERDKMDSAPAVFLEESGDSEEVFG
ncbi:MAG: hypothetical protein LUH56_03025 [Oscillospiraceae bacterium]|nr:hypothetical protein [Oscillospiraceae bacterium]